MSDRDQINRFRVARDEERAARDAASAAMASTMRRLAPHLSWTPMHASSGIGAEVIDRSIRVGWTDLDKIPRVVASVRSGSGYLAVYADDPGDAWEMLSVRAKDAVGVEVDDG